MYSKENHTVSEQEMDRRATIAARVHNTLGLSAVVVGGLSSVNTGEIRSALLSGALGMGIIARGAFSVYNAYIPENYSYTAPETIDASSQTSPSASNSRR